MDTKEMLVLEDFINGKFESLPETIENVDPSTGIVYSRLPNSGSREVDKDVHAAMQAFSTWSMKSPAECSELLIRIADLIESRVGEFAQAESRDQGKPVWLARTVDIPRAVHNFRHFATTSQQYHYIGYRELAHWLWGAPGQISSKGPSQLVLYTK
ncbi:hypothetical protein MRX96_031759 [Rhipicephalus microplus]